MDCLSNIAVVTWSGSAGAEFYTAAVTDWQGGETCMSSSEQCGMPNLDCGQNYTVTVTASVSVSLLDLCSLSQHPSVNFFPHFLSLCRLHAQRTEASPSWRSSVWDLQCCCCYSMGLL
jgi:hypothetical protein